MRRLLAAALTAVAVLAPAAPAQAYDCGGVVDIFCTGWVCPTDCWERECLVWVDPLHDPSVAQCVRDLRP